MSAAEITSEDLALVEARVVAALHEAPTARTLGQRLAAIAEAPVAGLDRLRGWKPVSLRAIAESLTLRRLTDEVRAELIQLARAAIREARTWAALGKALGSILNAVAARYGA